MQQRHPGQRTNFVVHARPSHPEKLFHLRQHGSRRGLEHPQAKRLRQRRPGSVEHGVSTANPLPHGISAARFNERRAGKSLRTFQSPRKFQISKHLWLPV